MNYNTTFLVVKSSPVYSDVCGKVYKNGIELYGKAEILMKQEPIRHFPWILFLRNIQHMEMVTIVSMVWRQSRRTEVTLPNLKYESYEISKGKYSLKGLPAMFAKEDEAETLEIVLKDHASGLRAHLLYGVFPQLDVITRAVRLENTGTAPVTVKKAMSMEMDYEYRELDAVHFYGKHNMERQMERTHLGHGNWSVGSIRGTSCHYH